RKMVYSLLLENLKIGRLLGPTPNVMGLTFIVTLTLFLFKYDETRARRAVKRLIQFFPPTMWTTPQHTYYMVRELLLMKGQFEELKYLYRSKETLILGVTSLFTLSRELFTSETNKPQIPHPPPESGEEGEGEENCEESDK